MLGILSLLPLKPTFALFAWRALRKPESIKPMPIAVTTPGDPTGTYFNPSMVRGCAKRTLLIFGELLGVNGASSAGIFYIHPNWRKLSLAAGIFGHSAGTARFYYFENEWNSNVVQFETDLIVFMGIGYSPFKIGWLNIGANVKSVYSNIGGALDAVAVCADLGLTYAAPFLHGLVFALTAQNIGIPLDAFRTEKEPLPASVMIAASYSREFENILRGKTLFFTIGVNGTVFLNSVVFEESTFHIGTCVPVPTVGLEIGIKNGTYTWGILNFGYKFNCQARNISAGLILYPRKPLEIGVGFVFSKHMSSTLKASAAYRF